MSKTITVTCPNCGETIEVVQEKKPRGQLAGIPIEEMTDEQLKREIINANSVLYKAKQRGASEETVAANQARVDAAKAERAKRNPEPEPEPEPEVVADEPMVETDEVYAEATEI